MKTDALNEETTSPAPQQRSTSDRPRFNLDVLQQMSSREANRQK